MKTIYNTYVVIESQEQCDRMKQLCIDNGLKISNLKSFFLFYGKYFFYYSGFFGLGSFIYKKQKITEKQFIELLKNTKL